MVLVYIENSQLLSKVIMLLENSKIIFTTDFNDNYDILLVAQFNKRTVKMVRNNYFLKKKIVFLTYLEESKININYNSNNKLSTDYQINLNDFLNLFDLIIVSLPYFKKLLNKNINRNIIVIEKTVSLFDDNVYSRYKLNKRRRKILYLDNKFDYITDFFKIALSNPKMDFIMIGFLPDYYLTKYKKQLLMNKPNNVKCIKYYDDLVLNELIKIVDCIIYTDKVIDMTIVYKSLFYKKNLIVRENNLFNDYLLDNKNIYLFDKENFVKKCCKLLKYDIANLTMSGYDVVKKNKFSNIVNKINDISL